MAAGSMSSSATIRSFLYFTVQYATLKDASRALVCVRKKLESTTGCLFIFDKFRMKTIHVVCQISSYDLLFGDVSVS